MTGDLWRPTSACGPACVSSTVQHPAPVPIRLLRLVRLAGVMVAAVLATPVLAFAGTPVRRRALRRFARGALAALAVRVEPHGAARRRGPALVVANHISWVDILVLLADVWTGADLANLRLVAKVEVRGWPVVGRLASMVGTIYIDRTRPRDLPVAVNAVREALAAGERVVAFPEGTTSCGRATGEFRPAMFQAALDAGVAVVPIRLRYRLPDGTTTTAPAFVGDETLLESLRRVLALPGVQVEAGVCGAIHPAIRPGSLDRRDARDARRALARLAGAVMGAGSPRVAARIEEPVAA